MTVAACASTRRSLGYRRQLDLFGLLRPLGKMRRWHLSRKREATSSVGRSERADETEGAGAALSDSNQSTGGITEAYSEAGNSMLSAPVSVEHGKKAMD